MAYLAMVWFEDAKAKLPEPQAGREDFSRLEHSQPSSVIRVSSDPQEAERQLAGIIAKANQQHLKISISGAKHSMGGHTLYPGGVALDMLPFNGLELDESAKILHVGAGARWSEVIPFLDRHGLAMAVMQSNNDFSVGGSLSVNCHGWQPDAPPIASTVESFRLIDANGEIKQCSRIENPELFSLALGGYGLFGVILDARIRVVPNEFYRASHTHLLPSAFSRSYRSAVEGNPEVGLAVGRVSIAPAHFLDDALLISFQRTASSRPVVNTLRPASSRFLERLLFRGCVGSDYGKNLCWDIEAFQGGAPFGSHSRNEIMNEPADWYVSRDLHGTEILQEYFVPPEKFTDFLDRIKPILRAAHPDLLNITVRKVKADSGTVLAYAREDVFALVMYFHQELGVPADAHMQVCTRQLIDVALACGGTYYLPYRLQASTAQFERAYPRARAFFAAKRKYDPAGVFQNEFYLRYGAPMLISP